MNLTLDIKMLTNKCLNYESDLNDFKSQFESNETDKISLINQLNEQKV